MLLFRPGNNLTPSASAASRLRRSRRHRPAIDGLEGRQLLTIGPEFLVNTTTAKDQITAANASSSDGRSVVVWAHEFSDTDRDIRGRLYQNGVPLGPDFSIDAALEDSYAPSVAMDDHGNFVLAYQHSATNQIRSIVRKVSVDYSQATPRVTVGSPIDLGPGSQSADVAADADGNFVVVYTKVNFSPGATADVIAHRYNASGQFLGTVNTQASPLSQDYSPSVAMLPDGRFAIAYTYEYTFGPFNRNVWVTRYDKFGNLLWGRDAANTSALEQGPDIGLDGAGNAVVAYQKVGLGGADIKAKRIGTGGGLMTGEIAVSPAAHFDEHPTNPVVAVNRNSGAFVVGYQSRPFPSSLSDYASIVEVSSHASGNVVAPPHLVPFDSWHVSVSMDGDGDYLVTYTGTNGATTDILGRRGRRT